MTSHLSYNGSPGVSLTTDSVVSQWRRLASTDKNSPNFFLLLSELATRTNRSKTIQLRGDDASVILGIMDGVLTDGRTPSEQEYDILHIMRTLAYNSGQVPPRYQVIRRSLTRDVDVFATGAFAEVRKGSLDGREVAIKTLRIDRTIGGKEPQQLFCKESVIWMNLSHPNILELIGVDIDPQTGQYSMISEMMINGNIREYIRKNSANRLRLLRDAAAGLDYLHHRGIVHGDLKGNNILINNEAPPRACLADFGLATLAPSTEGWTNGTSTVTTGGTLLYMAPELLFPTKFGHSSATPAKAADIYALGMVIYEVLTGLQPFHERKWPLVEIFYRVVDGERPTRPDGTEQIGFGGETWKLVEECWRSDPAGRPTAESAHAHLERVSAFSADVDPTPGMPLVNPSSKFGLSDASQSSDPTASTTQRGLSTNNAVSSTFVSPGLLGIHHDSLKPGLVGVECPHFDAQNPHLGAEGHRVEPEVHQVIAESRRVDAEDYQADAGDQPNQEGHWMYTGWHLMGSPAGAEDMEDPRLLKPETVVPRSTSLSPDWVVTGPKVTFGSRESGEDSHHNAEPQTQAKSKSESLPLKVMRKLLIHPSKFIAKFRNKRKKLREPVLRATVSAVELSRVHQQELPHSPRSQSVTTSRFSL